MRRCYLLVRRCILWRAHVLLQRWWRVSQYHFGHSIQDKSPGRGNVRVLPLYEPLFPFLLSVNVERLNFRSFCRGLHVDLRWYVSCLGYHNTHPNPSRQERKRSRASITLPAIHLLQEIDSQIWTGLGWHHPISSALSQCYSRYQRRPFSTSVSS